MKVIVVGCTHAGTSAVKTILKENPGTEVTVYERNDNVSFLSCGIALYVGGVAAVILDESRPIAGLNDSKQLSEAKREALFPLMRRFQTVFAYARVLYCMKDRPENGPEWMQNLIISRSGFSSWSRRA